MDKEDFKLPESLAFNTIENKNVIYGGESLNLQNVLFKSCDFQFENEAANALLFMKFVMQQGGRKGVAMTFFEEADCKRIFDVLGWEEDE